MTIDTSPSVEEVVNSWDIKNFITRICLFCEYVVQEEADFRKHLLENHKEELKEHFDL